MGGVTRSGGGLSRACPQGVIRPPAPAPAPASKNVAATSTHNLRLTSQPHSWRCQLPALASPRLGAVGAGPPGFSGRAEPGRAEARRAEQNAGPGPGPGPGPTFAFQSARCAASRPVPAECRGGANGLPDGTERGRGRGRFEKVPGLGFGWFLRSTYVHL